MSYPIDQFASLARANGELALRLAAITRAAGGDWMAAGTRVAEAAFGQVTAPPVDGVPGRVQAAHAHLTAIADELRGKAELHAAELSDALTHWQGAWQAVLTSDGLVPQFVEDKPAAKAAPATKKTAPAKSS